MLKFWQISCFVTDWSVDLNFIVEINLWKWGWIVKFKLSTDDVDAEIKKNFIIKYKLCLFKYTIDCHWFSFDNSICCTNNDQNS